MLARPAVTQSRPPISPALVSRSDSSEYLELNICPPYSFGDRFLLSLELTHAYPGLEVFLLNRAEWLKAGRNSCSGQLETRR